MCVYAELTPEVEPVRDTHKERERQLQDVSVLACLTERRETLAGTQSAAEGQ